MLCQNASLTCPGILACREKPQVPNHRAPHDQQQVQLTLDENEIMWRIKAAAVSIHDATSLGFQPKQPAASDISEHQNSSSSTFKTIKWN